MRYFGGIAGAIAKRNFVEISTGIPEGISQEICKEKFYENRSIKEFLEKSLAEVPKESLKKFQKEPKKE